MHGGTKRSTVSKARHAANVRWHGKSYKTKKSVSKKRSRSRSKKKSNRH